MATSLNAGQQAGLYYLRRRNRCQQFIAQATQWAPGLNVVAGDIVQNKLVPFTFVSVKNWIAILDKLEPLKPRFVVPDHGSLGDGSLIAQRRAFFEDLQKRALELKKQGVPVEDAAKMVTAEFRAKYAGWENMNALGNGVRRVYEESQ